eukprot:TRINITY_DN6197_c0_g1_i1.p1 TRINITY_DN6197_c0_g1~~TRINITY_DN6197_c0_g1_i1.p1  ORF type:complete len:186 (-),score=59.03 TRINITY_DN6197_c0_g1_i1:3-560(-)
MSKLIVEGIIPVEGKEILELGTGTGLSGLTCAACGARKVVMSDYHQKVLDNVSVNIELNGMNDIAMAKKIDWREFDGKGGKGTETYEMIVGSDINYELYHSIQVPKVVKDSLKRRSKEDNSAQFCVVNTLRFTTHKKEIETFNEEMKANGFIEVERIEEEGWEEEDKILMRFQSFRLLHEGELKE